MKKLHKTMIAAALAAAGVGISAPAMAVPGITFDPDGAGGTYSPKFNDQWTWKFTTVMFEDAVRPVTGGTYTDQVATLRVQGVATAGTDSTNAVNSTIFDDGPMSNLTFVLDVPVIAARTGASPFTATGDAIALTTPLAGTITGDFRLYYHAAGFDDSTDTGTPGPLYSGDFVTGGAEILSGKTRLFGTNNLSIDTLAPGEPAITALDTVAPQNSNYSSADTRKLRGQLAVIVDVCDANAEPGGNSANCAGEPASTVDTDFFVDTIFDSLAFNLDLDVGSQTAAPFTNGIVPDEIGGVAPAFGFSSPGSGSTINSLVCEGPAAPTTCDVIASASKSGIGTPVTAWRATTVPEPGSLALLSLGLLGIGSAVRRRRG